MATSKKMYVTKPGQDGVEQTRMFWKQSKEWDCLDKDWILQKGVRDSDTQEIAEEGRGDDEVHLTLLPDEDTFFYCGKV